MMCSLPGLQHTKTTELVSIYMLYSQSFSAGQKEDTIDGCCLPVLNKV